ncbi:hypothetical protein Ancab_037872 [Ancistrocladus abbreviatus]
MGSGGGGGRAIHEITQQMDLIRFPDAEPSVSATVEDTLYVAVGKEVKDSERTLLWALQNSGGRKICILHVHQPSEMIPILGGMYHASHLKEQQVRAYRDIERQIMFRTLDAYLDICSQLGVWAEKLHIESDSIEQGILDLISIYKIEKLVMGAAADGSYYTRMIEPKSKKAKYVQCHAPANCQIWFICKGDLIYIRKGSQEGRLTAKNELSKSSWFPSMMEQSSKHNVSSLGQALYSRESSVDFGGSIERITGSSSFIDSAEGSSYEAINYSAADPLELCTWSYSTENHHQQCPHSAALKENVDIDLYAQHKHAMLRAGNSRREASEELVRCQKAQMEAVCMAKASETLYLDELRRRKEIEESLEKMKVSQEQLMKELQIATDLKLSVESQFEDIKKDLEDKVASNVELLQIYEKERDEMRMERDNALKLTDELLHQSAEVADKMDSKFFCTLSFSEIKEATNDFDPSLQLWEGECGSIYRGFLSHTEVTIRMFHPDGQQNPSEFHKEVEVLGKFRHPNLVNLVGACPEAWALVYEYLPNGSLEDRLSCKDNTPPLPWKTRISVATALCSVLIFLHSRKPLGVVHGVLTPACIMLDSNFTCKVRDFGFSHMILTAENASSSTSSHTGPYIYPEFLETREIAPNLDVYSFGIILLQLLTGKPAFQIREQVENALNEDDFGSVLDSSAGQWPFLQAQQLARLALRCCDVNSSDRPDLESEIWRVLKPMMVSCGGSVQDQLCEAPSYFICPILQEVMTDPQVAADGFTYEAEALRGWLDSGHDTSPMTNVTLEHTNLVPNHALRSAIQEWLQDHR